MFLKPKKKFLFNSAPYYAVTGGIIGPPTFVYQGQQNTTSIAGDTATIAATSIGTASANRRVVILFNINGFGATILSATIGGVTCDTISGPLYNDTTNFNIGFMISTIVPTGTTAGAVINFSPGGATGLNFGVPFYTVDNTTLINPTSPTTSGTTLGAVSSITGAVVTLTGSSVLMFCNPSGGTPSGTFISASDAGLTTTNSFGVALGGFANGASASAANHATVSWTGTSVSAGIMMVAYR